MAKILSVAGLVVLCFVGIVLASPRVTIERLNNHEPVLGWALNNSVFPYTYNPSWLEGVDNGCMLVRCQNVTSPTNPSPGPSRLAVSCLIAGTTEAFTPIVNESVVFEPETPEEVMGTEDPRVQKINDTYYLFYTAVQKGPTDDWIARLSLATTTTPLVKSSWQRHGALFPDVNEFQFTKSGALLVGDSWKQSYLIFGDCSLYNGLQVAVPTDETFTRYRVLEDYLLIEKRQGKFDSGLVESGPPPMKLHDGNWFFIYNAAQHLYGTPNGFFYNAGWVVLNGSDPLTLMARSDTPLLMPEQPYEVMGLTPYVVFIEAMREDPGRSTQDSTAFIVYYGAADTSVAVVRVVVQSTGDGSYGVSLSKDL